MESSGFATMGQMLCNIDVTPAFKKGTVFSLTLGYKTYTKGLG